MKNPDPADNPTTFLGGDLGAGSARFGVYSAHASLLELCLFDSSGGREEQRLAMDSDGRGHWSLRVSGLEAGQLYGYRAHGEHRPAEGLWFDANKLLVDPRARAITGRLTWDPSILAVNRQPPGSIDTAPFVPRGVLVDSSFDWGSDRPPCTPLDETVVYECHVRGQTMTHPGIPESLRGTYLGLSQEPMIDHLKSLGVTAVELMPVLHFETEKHLAEQACENYWGYAPLGFLAPHAGYARGTRGRQVTEFKQMVLDFHQAGIEVILDVVYNHTMEGDHHGATVSLRGLDNPTYYRLQPDHPGDEVDWTGCGNTLNVDHPAVRRLIIDSLRYWADEMHVDGFRFDLATVLARSGAAVTPRGSLIQEISEDPILSRLKLIAEPWDLGPGGHQLGGFPEGWSEWNDRFRESQRAFWRGDPGHRKAVAASFAGSCEVLAKGEPGTSASLNYITSHDGFTLEDLVSYETKHNAANGEDNRDGANHNLSCNWGEEGPTESGKIQATRQRIKRNLMASLAFSRGIPMIAHGDELARTQNGNNNAYCQDGPTTWIDWDLDPAKENFLTFCRGAFATRARHRELRSLTAGSSLQWFRSDGLAMTDSDWDGPEQPLIALFTTLEADQPGAPSLALAINNLAQPQSVALPAVSAPGHWRSVVHTAETTLDSQSASVLKLEAHSLTLLEFSPTDTCPLPGRYSPDPHSSPRGSGNSSEFSIL